MTTLIIYSGGSRGTARGGGGSLLFLDQTEARRRDEGLQQSLSLFGKVNFHPVKFCCYNSNSLDFVLLQSGLRFVLYFFRLCLFWRKFNSK